MAGFHYTNPGNTRSDRGEKTVSRQGNKANVFPCRIFFPIHVIICESVPGLNARLKNMSVLKGFLIDLGGVVYQGDTALPGSIEAINSLRQNSVPFRFLTNTTSRPKSGILKKLITLGIDVEPDDVFTPAAAARAYVAEHKLNPHYLIAPQLMEDFRRMETGSNPAVIIADAREGFNFQNLNLAFRELEAGAELIALANNRKFADDDDLMCLDVGAFVAALEYASGEIATVLGKPSPDFFHAAARSLGLDPAQTAMIGDDAEFDASAAVRAGLHGYVVHTGKWQAGACDGLDPQPTGEFADLAQAVETLIT